MMRIVACSLVTLGLGACSAPGAVGTGAEKMTNAVVSSPSLTDTDWRLVEIQSMDDRVFVPTDPDVYTLGFGDGGRLMVRADCNRAQGTWTSTPPSGLMFGQLAGTMAVCPPGSLHDRFMSDLNYVRSYVFEEGHLFLATMADSAILEFEPFVPSP